MPRETHKHWDVADAWQEVVDQFGPTLSSTQGKPGHSRTLVPTGGRPSMRGAGGAAVWIRAFIWHLELQAAVGAGAWFVPPLAEDAQAMLYRISLKRRLWQPLHGSDKWCGFCGAIMGRFGVHALVCPCKCDRARRHHGLRNTLADAARATGT